MAGFTITKNRFEADVERCLIGEVENFNKMIIRYIRLFNNPIMSATVRIGRC